MTLNERLKEVGFNVNDRRLILEIFGLTEKEADKEGKVRVFIYNKMSATEKRNANSH